MQDYFNLLIDRRKFFPLFAAPFIALGGLSLLSLSPKPAPYVNRHKLELASQLTEQQPLVANYVRVNDPGGVLFRKDGRETMIANLYIDTHTADSDNQYTKLDLTSRLYVNPMLLAFARRIGKTKRKSPVIVKEDIVTDFTDISKLYEISSESYSNSNTINLELMLTSAGAIPESMPVNYRLEIINDSKSLRIISYTDGGETINTFTVIPQEQIASWKAWVKNRLNHPYAELQKTDENGNKTNDITHMTFLKNHNLELATASD